MLETYASNDAMNQLILSNLDASAWRAQPPGEKGNGRTIAAIFAHLHNCRLVWLKNSAPHLKSPPSLHPERLQSQPQPAARHAQTFGDRVDILADGRTLDDGRGELYVIENLR